MLAHVDAVGLTDHLVGESTQMQVLREQVAQLSRCDVSLLLEGESGVGKELVSRTIHALSKRTKGPFIGVNCAAIHESLLESELFGHEAGAFTGADRPSLGFLRAADGGTILLDEVGDMSKPLQSKLLRVLEERSVIPVGGTEGTPIDVRFIAATNRDLAQAVADGTFRRDLYYRLNVVRLQIPPLRERPEDIEPLVESLLVEMSRLLALPLKTISPEALALMMGHHWPGNVRQLGNVIQHAYALGRGREIHPEDLPGEILGGLNRGDAGASFPSLRQATRLHVEKALNLSGGIRTKAARLLGVDRKSLWRMMRRFDID
jgi:transcriptional regulator with PAS, ATPase and Fis domain